MTARQRKSIQKVTSSMHADGFTLLEIMMVLSVLAILATLAIQEYSGYREKIDIAQAKADINSIEIKINTFYVANGSFPDTVAEIGGVPIDPWGNPYKYLNIQTTKGKGKVRKDHSLVPINSDFDLYSMGKDGKSVSPLTAKSSHDDIIRANNGGYYGLAKDY